MRMLIGIFLGFLVLAPQSTLALSCLPPNEDAVPQADLIVLGEVISNQSTDDAEILEMNVLKVYSSHERAPKTFTARMEGIFRAWGPDLKAGDQGEYLFNRDENGAWVYAGPGACTYFSETAWEALRKNAKAPE